MTNKQLIIIGAFVLATTALILGYKFEDVVRVLPILLGLG